MSTAFANRDLRATALRAQIEASLSGRFDCALTPAPRQVRETLLTGVDALDTMLGGGVPVGVITELVGAPSSGRTTLALSVVASAMREGNMCAWVDASDAFDPESAAANGVCLEHLLWVRCGASAVAQPGSAAAETGSGRMEAHTGRGRAGQHPREEVRGLDLAVGELLRERQEEGESTRRDRSIGTPGAPNRSLILAEERPGGQRPDTGAKAGGRMFSPVRRSEQVASDRQPSRRTVHTMHSADTVDILATQPARLAVGDRRLSQPQRPAPGFAERSKPKPWTRLDQALRAADLLLQAGGFRVLVLDLGSIAPEHGLRIPLATWFRFRAAADQGRTVLLLLMQASCARSSAGLVLQLDGLEIEDATLPVLDGIRYQARPMRQRFSGPLSSVVAMDRPGPRYEARLEPHQGARSEPRRPPQATWQLSAYPLREQRGSA